MFKRSIAFVICLTILLGLLGPTFAVEPKIDESIFSTEQPMAKGELDSKANNNTAKNKGKVILIDLNRTSYDNFKNIKFLSEQLKKSGYLGMMNIRGDKGYDDRRNYASMGATGRVNILPDTPVIFSQLNDKNLYKYATGQTPKKINLLSINNIDEYNQTNGEYKSKLAYLGDSLIGNNKKIAILGNSDYFDISNGQEIKNRDYALMVMDSRGRIEDGNIDYINKEDKSFPFGISTDYTKLKNETQKFYLKSDLLMVNLGDTFRLDEYKVNLNSKSYTRMKYRVYRSISDYLEYVFKMAGKNDTIYIMGSFPSKLDYSNNRRLAALVRFDMSDNSKGLLLSSTTRRPGVLANVDLGVDILNRFGLKNTDMIGRVLLNKPMDNRDEYMDKDYKKIVAISSIRMTIINIYVAVISISWIIGALALWQRDKLPVKHKKKILNILKEMVKLGLIMPLAFLSAPILRPGSQLQITLAIIFMTVLLYLLGSKIFKDDDIKQVGFYSVLMILLIVVDSVISTPLMQSNIMSYDPMIGARYYGIGNEYEGATIGSAILGTAILLEYKKIPKIWIGIFLLVVLISSAYPSMGANVGGAISESIAYIAFLLMIFGFKIDYKKAILVVFITGAVVVLFAAADIVLGMGSHLGNFVNQVLKNGPMEIITVFGRKIAMNVQLAQTTVWVNILLVGLFILGFTIFRPNRHFTYMKEKYTIVYDGYLAIIVGCLVTLLVNDSGIIAAATDSIYLLIPIIIILINKFNEKEDILISE
nr:hypothetical protein [uncultured Peptostreptococcus sp.]